MRVIIILLLALATDRRPIGDVAAPVPYVAGEYHEGRMFQAGRELRLVGHGWRAEGAVREDGSIFLVWISASSGFVAGFGIYRTDECDLVGRYATRIENGELARPSWHERLRRAE